MPSDTSRLRQYSSVGKSRWCTPDCGLDKESLKSLERVCREPGVPVLSRSTCQIWARLHLRADIWVARSFIGKDSVCLGLLGIRGQNLHLTEEPWISCCAGTRAVYL